MRRKRSMEIAQIIDNSLAEWYSERGLEVPQWKSNANPQWWIDYLASLGIDPKNP
tara:strand:- start:811 stop:975 length:165 start_codon:yes stop_codon:yes gene_type:complete